MQSLIAEGLIHINGTLLWIAAIAMITVELIGNRDKQQEDSESRFGARVLIMVLIATILAGSTGLFFLYEWEVWSRVSEVGFWWIHAMILAWILFGLIFFLVDPLVSENRK